MEKAYMKQPCHTLTEKEITYCQVDVSPIKNKKLNA